MWKEVLMCWHTRYQTLCCQSVSINIQLKTIKFVKKTENRSEKRFKNAFIVFDNSFFNLDIFSLNWKCLSRVVYIEKITGALFIPSSKNKKKNHSEKNSCSFSKKVFFCFGKWNFLASRLKKFLYFPPKSFSYISGNGTFQAQVLKISVGKSPS